MSLITFLFFRLIFIFIFYFAWNKFIKKKKIDFKKYLSRFFFSLSLALSICILLIGSFVYYENELSPAKMPIYTISNGNKTIIFQTMSHVGSRTFYKEVQEKIKDSKKD